uniref:Uncharacterized protein n=1 Tax=Geospiza parvula TaxID=87175 RepID=A0A8U8B8D2_GEOPR
MRRGERRGKKTRKGRPGRTWQPLTIDQLLHLVVPGPQVGLGVGALGRDGLAADSTGGRQVLLPGLPVSSVPGGFVPAALAGHSHGEEPGGRAAAPPQRRRAQRRHGPAADRWGCSAHCRGCSAAAPAGGQSPGLGARGSGPRSAHRGRAGLRGRGRGLRLPLARPRPRPAPANQARRYEGEVTWRSARPSVRPRARPSRGSREGRRRRCRPAMLVSERLKRLLRLVPGERRFGFYRFLPFFFVLGGAMEWFMINVRIGKETFYDVYRRKQSERQYEARMEKGEFSES